MPTLANETRNDMLTAIKTRLGVGAKLKFRNAGTATIAEITDLPGDAFEDGGATADGQMNAFGATTPTAVCSGSNLLVITGNATASTGTNIADAVLTESDDTIQITLTVGTSGTDIIVDNVNIADGQDCNISQLRLNMPAS